MGDREWGWVGVGEGRAVFDMDDLFFVFVFFGLLRVFLRLERVFLPIDDTRPAKTRVPSTSSSSSSRRRPHSGRLGPGGGGGGGRVGSVVR